MVFSSDFTQSLNMVLLPIHTSSDPILDLTSHPAIKMAAITSCTP